MAAIALVSWSTYHSWTVGPWDLPAPPKSKLVVASVDSQTTAPPKMLAGTDVIVSKNLFDPERGAGFTREAEENSRAFQRVRNMILVGTIILGNDRFALLQDGGNLPGQGAPGQGQSATPLRLKLGDNVEGFRLSEIADKRVVFTRESSRVEVLLDFFRKTELAQPRLAAPGAAGTPGTVAAPGAVAPGGVAPRVAPNLPRRARIPIPQNQPGS